jgi:DNA-binding MarR family transcriptional regulator
VATSPAARAAATEIALVDAIQAMSRAVVAVTTRSLAGMAEEATLAQYRALVVLVSHGPQRVSDLAAELNVAPSTASRLCERLVGKGLAMRSRRDNDRRAVWISLTETGADVIGSAMRLRREAIRRLLLDLPTNPPSEVADVLNAFAAAAGEPSETDWWRRWRSIGTRPEETRDAWPDAWASTGAETR